MTWAERDFNDWERRQEEYEAKLPRCDKCGEPMDEYYDIEGEQYCYECAMDWLEHQKHEVYVD